MLALYFIVWLYFLHMTATAGKQTANNSHELKPILYGSGASARHYTRQQTNTLSTYDSHKLTKTSACNIAASYFLHSARALYLPGAVVYGQNLKHWIILKALISS